MKMCAIESSTAVASVAFLEDGHVLAEGMGPPSQGRSESLFDLLESTRAQTGWAWSDMDGYAAGCGPGRYAGMRVACMTALHLALPGNNPVHGVPSGTALAHQLAHAHPGVNRITVMGDARRGHFWAGEFRREQDALTLCGDWRLQPWDTLAVSSDPHALYVTSDWTRLAPRLGEVGAPLDRWLPSDTYPTATWVGRLAIASARSNPVPSPCMPIYLHPPV